MGRQIVEIKNRELGIVAIATALTRVSIRKRITTEDEELP